MKQIYSITESKYRSSDYYFGKHSDIIRNDEPKIVYYDDEKEFKPCRNCNSQNREAIKTSSPHPLACVPVNVHGYLIPTGSIYEDKNTYMLRCHDCGETMCELSESEVEENRIPKKYSWMKEGMQ